MGNGNGRMAPPSAGRRGWIVAAVAIAVAAAAWLVPRLLVDGDPWEELARQLGVSPDELVGNLPPRPSRYPGTVLLRLQDIPVSFVEADDPALERGAEYALDLSRSTEARASGGLESPVLDELARGAAAARLELELEVASGRVVESPAEALAERVRGSRVVRRAIEAGFGADVVVRAFEGSVRYRVSRSDSASLEAWGALVRGVAAADAGDAAVTVEVEGSLEQATAFAVAVAEPTVFAYTVASAASLADLSGPPQYVRRDARQADPARAVRELVEIGSAALPDATRTLRAIGPRAGPELLELRDAPDLELRVQSLELYRQLPAAQTGAADAGSVGARLGQLQGAGADALRAALEDPDPGVRTFAAERLGALGGGAAGQADALRARLEDPDPVVREVAAGALARIVPEAELDARTLELGRRRLELHVAPGAFGPR